jgi:hypothetical protein
MHTHEEEEEISRTTKITSTRRNRTSRNHIERHSERVHGDLCDSGATTEKTWR